MRIAWIHDEEDPPLSERGIEQRKQWLLRRYREFRRGADAVTAAWWAYPEVITVSLIGSVEGSAALRAVPACAGRAVTRVQGGEYRKVWGEELYG